MFPASVASTLDGRRRTLAARIIEQGVEELRAAGLKVSVSIREHLPLDVLIEEAREWCADSIFVDALSFSRRPEKSNGEPRVSNVVKALAMGAPCSVEIVRAKSRPEEFLSPAA
jgi:nucleotide-binding universal stress UspA family protein